MAVIALRSPRATEVRRLLEREPDVNLYLLSALQSWGLASQDGVRWWGFEEEGALTALAWIGRPQPDPGAELPAGLAVPWGGPAGCGAIGRAAAPLGPPRMVIGPRAASDALWRGLGDAPARLWYEQRLYVCTGATPGPRLQLRMARPDEIPLVADLSAAMMAEDLQADPRDEDAPAFLRRIRARVLAGRCLLGLELGRVVFKVDVGSRYGSRTQVGGTYVVPGARGRGVGTAGMRALYQVLAPRTPRISLHVNQGNQAAVRTYEKAGFQAHAPFRLASH